METEKKDYSVRSTCAQVLATLAFNTLMVSVAMIVGMPVIVIGALRTEDHGIYFTDEQASWFGGLIFMVQPLGSVLSGFLQDLLGRKTCMMVVNIPELIGWLMMYYATSTTMMFAAVTFLGLSIGFMEAPVLSYIGEISEPRLRGVLSTFGGIFLNIGFILSSVIGAYTHWRTMILISASAPVISFLVLSLVPDSPAWLVSKGKLSEAQKAYQWLRGWVPPECVKDELDALVCYVKDTRKVRIVGQTEYIAVTTEDAGVKRESGFPGERVGEARESQWKIFLHPSIQRPLRLISVYFVVASCASLTAMRPFLIEVLTNLQVPIRPHLVIVFGCAVTLFGSITASLSMTRLGKRGLSFISLSLCNVCCLGLSLYLALGLNLPWVPLVLFTLSFLGVPLGLMCVPWILISELYPLKGRGLAGGVSAALGYLLMFVAIKTYYSLVSLVGLSGACLFYGLVGVIGHVYLYFKLPETEGVPLDVIEKLFDKKAKTDVQLERIECKE